MRQELLKGGTDQLILDLKVDGRPVSPSSCSCRILYGTEVLESGNAPGGVYTPSGAATARIYEDLIAEWTYTLKAGGPVQRRVEQFDTVICKLYPVVTDEDLMKESAGLASDEYIYRGTVTEASASGLVDSALSGRRDDWVGAVLDVLSGDQAGAHYIVSSMDEASGAVVYQADAYPAVGDSYTMRRTFQGEIEAAWADIYDKLVQACSEAPDGSRPYLIMTPDRLRRPHLLKSLEKVYRGRATDPSGIDWLKAEHYGREFESAWNGLKFSFAARYTDVPVESHRGSAQWGFGR